MSRIRQRTPPPHEIRAYDDVAGRLEAELTGIPAQTIYMGYTTDPYQPCETTSRQTRQILKILLEKGFSARILTKSDLVLRDLDLLAQMPDAGVSVSVAFTDEAHRRLFEGSAPETDARIAALKQARAAGIQTNALICPVIPHITRAIPLVRELTAWAGTIWIYGLSIRDRSARTWQILDPILTRHFPDLKTDVGNAVFSQGHAYWDGLRERLTAVKAESGLDLRIHV